MVKVDEIQTPLVLKHHVKTVHGDKNETIKCSKCSYSGTRKEILKHIRNEHSRPEMVSCACLKAEILRHWFLNHATFYYAQ